MEAAAIVVGFVGVVVAGYIAYAADQRRRVADEQAVAFSSFAEAMAKSSMAARFGNEGLQAEALLQATHAKALLLASCSEQTAHHLHEADRRGFKGDDPAVQAAIAEIVAGIRREGRRAPIDDAVVRALLFGSPAEGA